MAKKPFFPDAFTQQMLWLANFKTTLPTYATKYGIGAMEVTALNADANWLGFWWGAQESFHTFTQSLTAYKNETAYGLPEGTVPSVPPVPPVLGAAPPIAGEPGVFPRALAIAGRIKVHTAYTIADGEAMGLEGAEQTPVDVPNLKPVLKLVVSGETVNVVWKKNRTQGVEIMVKRGSAAWEFLALDTVPDYLDSHAFPAAAETWEYKAIYHYAGVRAGQWSDEVSVVVKA